MGLKIGDKVRIKSRKWYLDNRDWAGFVKLPNSGNFEFSPMKAKYCGYIFEIVAIFYNKQNSLFYYALRWADGFFTEDMFDALPYDAPLTINYKNQFGAYHAIEENAKWFDSFPLPHREQNNYRECNNIVEFQAIDNAAEDIIKYYYEEKRRIVINYDEYYPNAEIIGILRPYTFDMRGTYGNFYTPIPDYAEFCSMYNNPRIAALYVVVWRTEDNKEIYSIVSVMQPEYEPSCSNWANVHQEEEACSRRVKTYNSWGEVLMGVVRYVRAWFHKGKWDKDGISLIHKSKKVKIKPRSWYDSLKDEYGHIKLRGQDGDFSQFMSEYCGKVMTIKSQCSPNQYDLDNTGFWWPDWCFDFIEDKDVAEHDKSKSIVTNRTYCYTQPKTYLMHDANTGYTKIGKSINPRQRERTLQSEKPTITLFKICDMDIESNLHTKYAHKRIRGEWFDLDESEIETICNEHNFKQPN